MIGLPKARVSPLQSVLNAMCIVYTARLIVWLPRTFRISAFKFNYLHCADSTQGSRIDPPVTYLFKLPNITKTSSACLLLPSLFVRHVHLTAMILVQRTSMAQTRAVTIIGHSLWNQLPLLTRSSLLADETSTSISFSFSQDFSLFSGALIPQKHYINVFLYYIIYMYIYIYIFTL